MQAKTIRTLTIKDGQTITKTGCGTNMRVSLIKFTKPCVESGYLLTIILTAEGNYIWVDAETASKLPFTTEHAPSEGHTNDYIVGLSVFHVLHCLSVLRRNIYPRRYNSSMVNSDGTIDFSKWHHVDHCLETVRRDILCHADTGATTWEWIARTQMTIRPETKHVCRNFDRISEWAYERHVKAGQRAHVEGGKVVDYTGQPPSEEWDKIAVKAPEDWAYRVEDL